ncbi:MAG: SRPBCC domain-containing protein [bacterium]
MTDPDALARWFPGITVERKKGGSFQIYFGGEGEGPAHVEGILTECDPPNVLQMGSMRYELESNNAGCLLRFSDILHFDGLRTRQQFAVSVLGGWHACLDKLELALDGKPTTDVAEPDYSRIQVPGWKIL